MLKKQYIERETAVEILKEKSLKMFNAYYKGYVNAIRDLINIPSADVQEVVRCKDCKYRYSSEFCECREPDFYCADGERKDGESNE